MFKMIIRKRIESQNVRDHWHWAQRSKDRDDWGSRFVVQIYNSGALSYLNPTCKRRVKVTSYRRVPCDLGNIIGGAKGMIDALKRARLIFDDSPQWMECEYEQKKRKESPAKDEDGKPCECTVIEIEDMPDEKEKA